MTIREMFDDPIIRKYSNCVCYAMQDPFAGLCRGAMDNDYVIGKIKSTPEVGNGGIMVWWGYKSEPDGYDKGYHMAIIDCDKYREQCGIGGKIRLSDVADVETGCSIYKHSKRISAIDMPILSNAEFWNFVYNDLLTNEDGLWTALRIAHTLDKYIEQFGLGWL